MLISSLMNVGSKLYSCTLQKKSGLRTHYYNALELKAFYKSSFTSTLFTCVRTVAMLCVQTHKGC